MSLRRLRLLAFAPALCCAAVFAQNGGFIPPADDGVDWMVALSAMRDDDAYQSALASLHLGVGEATWLSLTGGSSRAPSSEQDVSAGLASIGIEHNFGTAGIGFSIEDWGDKNNLESQDWQGELFFAGDRYRIGLIREHRSIDIFFSLAGAPTPTDLRKFDIDADGFGLDWRFRAAEDWQVYGSWMDYDYPARVRLIPRADRLNLLSNSAVTLAYGFVDQYATVGFERSLGLKLINFDLSRDRSTIDGARVSSLAASVLWPASARVDLEFSLGQSRTDRFGSNLFGGLALLVYGGR